MTKTESATRWMENLANDNSHGYSWGGWGPTDYDCGHAIITAWETAGVPVKTAGAASTHNMLQVFTSLGFVDVKSSVNLTTGAGLQRGDVLLHETDHTAMACGDGKIVHARSSEGNTIPGDQNGQEIRIQPYFNWTNGGWQHVLRYPEAPEEGEKENEETPAVKPEEPKEKAYLHLERGDGMNAPIRRVQALQILLNEQDVFEWEATLDEDGEFGGITELAVKRFQERRGLTDDNGKGNGIVDELVWEELIQFEI